MNNYQIGESSSLNKKALISIDEIENVKSHKLNNKIINNYLKKSQVGSVVVEVKQTSQNNQVEFHQTFKDQFKKEKSLSTQKKEDKNIYKSSFFKNFNLKINNLTSNKSNDIIK